VLPAAGRVEFGEVLGVQMVERERFVDGGLGQFEPFGDGRRRELALVDQRTDIADGDPTTTDVRRGLDLPSEMLALGEVVFSVQYNSYVPPSGTVSSVSLSDSSSDVK
jgi:hypothetical protein